MNSQVRREGGKRATLYIEGEKRFSLIKFGERMNEGKGVSSRERRGHELRRGVDGKRNPKVKRMKRGRMGKKWKRRLSSALGIESESKKRESTSITYKVGFCPPEHDQKNCIELANGKLTQSDSI